MIEVADQKPILFASDEVVGILKKEDNKKALSFDKAFNSFRFPWFQPEYSPQRTYLPAGY